MVDVHLSRGPGRGSPIFYLPGAVFVALGLLIWFEPQSLVLLVAGGSIGLGLLLLLLGHRLRRGAGAAFQQMMRDRMRGPFGPS